MTKTAAAVSALLILLQLLSSASAQEVGDKEAAGACAACGGLIFMLIAILVINIAILVWVARDAKARGIASPAAWLILIFFTGLLGLIIYVLSRPSGALEKCTHCGNKRMKAMAKCPHCGN